MGLQSYYNFHVKSHFKKMFKEVDIQNLPADIYSKNVKFHEDHM